jgi:hypothetical protein
MTQPKILTILRHENSLNVVRVFAQELELEAVTVALDPVALPDCAAVVMGTKVYDAVKDGPSQLPEFLQQLQAWGIGQKPICLTHLQTMPADMQAMLTNTGLRVLWVDNDNLKRDGMSNLGPLIRQAITNT